ncbi:MAG: DNA polymerase III subunit delta [Patescibacteria group bacterium]
MLIYIYGEDTFRSREFLKSNIDRFKKERDPQGMNLVVLDAKKDEPSRIWNELTASPFLAEKRMVVIENPLSANAEVADSLVEGIKEARIPENNIAVFWQGEAMGKAKSVQELKKMLEKEKWARNFDNLKGPALLAWLKEQLAAKGGKTTPDALIYISQNVSDMWLAGTLLDQLVAYAGEKEITIGDAQLFLEEKVDDNIFNMVDAIVAGNRKQAFKLIQEQRRLGEDEFKIFAMIVRQFRILIQMRDLYNRFDNMRSDEMAKELGLHPFVAKKSLPLMKQFSLDKLKSIYGQLLEIDIKTKTGQGDQSLFIDLLVGKS